MGGCATLGRIVLILLNIVFVLISLALIAGGAILKYFPGLPMSFLMSGLTGLGGITLPPTPSGMSVTPPTGSVFIPKGLDFLPVAETAGVALLAVGGVLFALSFMACCGSCYKWRPLLVVFTIVVLIIVLSLAVVGGLFFIKDSILHKNIRDGLKDSTRKDMNTTHGPYALILNVLALKLNCCGFSGPSDFHDDWNSTGLSSVPKACCMKDPDAITKCFKTPDVSAYTTTGCYDKLLDLINNFRPLAIGAFVGILILLLLEAIFAIVITVDISSNKVGPM